MCPSRRNGATKLVGGGFQAGTLTLCRQSGRAGEGRQIILNAVGRPRVQKVALEQLRLNGGQLSAALHPPAS